MDSSLDVGLDADVNWEVRLELEEDNEGKLPKTMPARILKQEQVNAVLIKNIVEAANACAFKLSVGDCLNIVQVGFSE